MKVLLVNSVDAWTRSVATVHRFVAAGRALGHDVAVYGETNWDLPDLPFTTDIGGVDLALFIVQVSWDLPDMPYLARLLDGVPREKRVLVDLWGRFNDTVYVEHDFNHLEKVDGHPGIEWTEAFEAISDRILQPTLAPRRRGVGSFLWHGFDPAAVVRPYASAREAAAAWRASEKPSGLVYVGSNWQRWEQVRELIAQYEPARSSAGPATLIGWDWGERPEWAVKNAVLGIDTDAEFLAAHGVAIRQGVRFDEVVPLLGEGRFAPVIHRPLFRELGIVTNRTFETFYADALPILMLPKAFVAQIYGPAAVALVPEDGVAAYVTDAMQRPERYWDAVLKTRSHLASNHSYRQRFAELLAASAPPSLALGAAQ